MDQESIIRLIITRSEEIQNYLTPGVCKSCTTCGIGEEITVDCSETSDRICTPCTSGTY